MGGQLRAKALTVRSGRLRLSQKEAARSRQAWLAALGAQECCGSVDSDPTGQYIHQSAVTSRILHAPKPVSYTHLTLPTKA